MGRAHRSDVPDPRTTLARMLRAGGHVGARRVRGASAGSGGSRARRRGASPRRGGAPAHAAARGGGRGVTSVQVRAAPPPDTLAGPAFDALATDYDDRFTRGALGRLLRERVWARFDACFPPNGRILDVGSGTGEDAVYLAGRGHG